MGLFRVDEFNLAPTGDSPASKLLKSKEYTTGAAAVATDVFNDRTSYIEVMADVNVYFEEGNAPVAAPANDLSQMLLTPQIRPVFPSGQGNKLSVIDK